MKPRDLLEREFFEKIAPLSLSSISGQTVIPLKMILEDIFSRKNNSSEIRMTSYDFNRIFPFPVERNLFSRFDIAADLYISR